MNFSLQKNGRTKFRQKKRVIQGDRVIEGRVIEGFYFIYSREVQKSFFPRIIRNISLFVALGPQ